MKTAISQPSSRRMAIQHCLSIPIHFLFNNIGRCARSSLLAVFTAVCSGLFMPAQAGTLSFAGGFISDDEIWAKPFMLDQPTEITARTWSFGGGVNANGTLILSGGFDPVLALFEDGGDQLLLGISRGGTDPAGPNANPSFGITWDAFLTMQLNAGSYRLVLSQDDNLPIGPSWKEGYSWTGNPNFTSQYTSPYNPVANFILADGSQRDGHWAVDISPFDSTAIAEPSSFVLFLAGFLLLLLGNLRGKRSAPA